MLRTAGPRSTTSGSTTRSRSTTPQSPRPWPRSARSSRTPSTSTVASATSRRSPPRPSRTPACRSSTGTCYMHRQASFYAANCPEGTKVGPDGDVWAFYLPAVDASTKPVLAAGEFVAAFADRPEVKAFQTYLSSVGVGQRARQDLWLRWLRDGQQERRPEPADQRRRQAVGRDPHRQVRDVPVRRLRPHAGRRRFGHVLEGHDQLDHRYRTTRPLSTTSRTPGRRADPIDLTPGHPNRGGADALRPTPVLLSPLHPEVSP